jgi:hypothetical protein
MGTRRSASSPLAGNLRKRSKRVQMKLAWSLVIVSLMVVVSPVAGQTIESAGVALPAWAKADKTRPKGGSRFESADAELAGAFSSKWGGYKNGGPITQKAERAYQAFKASKSSAVSLYKATGYYLLALEVDPSFEKSAIRREAWGGLLNAWRGWADERSSRFSRMGFLFMVACREMGRFKPLGLQLLSGNPHDLPLKSAFVEAVFNDGRSTESEIRKSAALADELIAAEPNRPSYRFAHAKAYWCLSFFTENKKAGLEKARADLLTYQKGLPSGHHDAAFVETMLGGIKKRLARLK